MNLQLELDKNNTNASSLCGLTVYLELIAKLKLYQKLKEQFSYYHPCQGWDAASIVLVIIVLNLTGHDSVSDIDTVMADKGFVTIFREFLRRQMTSSEWRSWLARFNGRSNDSLPCATVIRDFLAHFHDPKMVAQKGQSVIHQSTDKILILESVITVLVNKGFDHIGNPSVITLDQDATLIPTAKSTAMYSYLMKLSYQPVNLYCPETGMIVATEFRDGNVPAKYALKEMLKNALDNLPNHIKQVQYRGDSASCQLDFMNAMDMGLLHSKIKIRFAVTALNDYVKKAYDNIHEGDWQKLNALEEYAETQFVHTSLHANCILRLVLIRKKAKKKEPKVDKPESGKQMSLNLFQDQEAPLAEDEVESDGAAYQVRGILSNQPIEKYSTKNLIQWSRNRAGKAEGAHSIQKNDLSGGIMPSNKFGSNWAWWLITNLALNINALLHLVASPKSLNNKRMKKLRASFIYAAGKVSKAGRGFKIIFYNAVSFNIVQLMQRRIQEVL